MDLNELAVGVVAALLVKRGLRRSGADDGVRGLAEDRADAAGGDDDGLCRETPHLHRAKIHGADAATDAVAIEYCRQEFPMLEFPHLTFGFVAADLVVERIEKLLPGGGSGKRSAVV